MLMWYVFVAAYTLGTFYCPNQPYFRTLRGLSEAEMMSSIASISYYGLMEVTSFILFGVLIKRTFNVNVLYIAAFVLEAHFFSIQGKMLFFLTQILNFNLIHMGTCDLSYFYGTFTEAHSPLGLQGSISRSNSRTSNVFPYSITLYSQIAHTWEDPR